MAMKLAAKGEQTPAGMERVTVTIQGTADIDMFMPAGTAEDIDESDQMFIDEVIQAADEHCSLMTDLDFEVSVVHVAERKKGQG
jgi:hypothetical protein